MLGLLSFRCGPARHPCVPARHSPARQHPGPLSLRYDYWEWCAEATAYGRKFMDAMRAANVDALLMPAHALPAYPHGAAKDLSFACSYTFVLNLINLPAGVVPVTVAKLQEDGLYSPPPDQDDL